MRETAPAPQAAQSRDHSGDRWSSHTGVILRAISVDVLLLLIVRPMGQRLASQAQATRLTAVGCGDDETPSADICRCKCVLQLPSQPDQQRHKTVGIAQSRRKVFCYFKIATVDAQRAAARCAAGDLTPEPGLHPSCCHTTADIVR